MNLFHLATFLSALFSSLSTYSGLKQLLDAQQLCDVTLLVEGKKFMCHRLVLCFLL